MAGIAGEFLLKLYLVILVSGKLLALRGWFGRHRDLSACFVTWSTSKMSPQRTSLQSNSTFNGERQIYLT